MKILEKLGFGGFKNGKNRFNEELYGQFIEELKKVSARDCVNVVPVAGEAGILDSKFGGAPYIPVGEEWPTYKDSGKKMPFVCQFKLSDMKLEGFPASGMLSVFGQRDDISYLEETKMVVKLYPEGEAYWEDLPSRIEDYDDYDEYNEYLYNNKAVKVQLVAGKNYPCWSRDQVNDEVYYLAAAKTAFGQDFANEDAVWDYIGWDHRDLNDSASMRLVNDTQSSPITLGGHMSNDLDQDEYLEKYDFALLNLDLEGNNDPKYRNFSYLRECWMCIAINKDKLQAGDTSDITVAFESD